jgi:hypothetical protein
VGSPSSTPLVSRLLPANGRGCHKQDLRVSCTRLNLAPVPADGPPLSSNHPVVVCAGHLVPSRHPLLRSLVKLATTPHRYALRSPSPAPAPHAVPTTLTDPPRRSPDLRVGPAAQLHLQQVHRGRLLRRVLERSRRLWSLSHVHLPRIGSRLALCVGSLGSYRGYGRLDERPWRDCRLWD